MSGNWKPILAELLRQHNHLHGRRDKAVSALTIQQRGDRLFDCFERLHELGYRIEDPRHIGERHVQALMDHWLEVGQAPATIQTKLSHLRVFAGWIGKPNLVKPAEEYVSDPNRVRRVYAAQTDASWSAKHIDAEAVIEHLRLFDPYVSNQQLAQLRFGLRVKESVMLQPRHADAGQALLVVDGAKGGRPRIVPVKSKEQRDALDYLKGQVRARDASLANPSLTLKQAMTRYYTVMRAAGITRKDLGITSHGLRKEFANQEYQAVTGVKSPVQGGPRIDREVDREARLRLVEQLGHARESIGTAYVGPILRGHRSDAVEQAEPAVDASGEA